MQVGTFQSPAPAWASRWETQPGLLGSFPSKHHCVERMGLLDHPNEGLQEPAPKAGKAAVLPRLDTALLVVVRKDFRQWKQISAFSPREASELLTHVHLNHKNQLFLLARISGPLLQICLMQSTC